MKYSLLNVSEFDNEWNRSVLDMAWKDREAAWAARSPHEKTPGQKPSPSEKKRNIEKDKK